jgi:Glycosyl transferases group 1
MAPSLPSSAQNCSGSSSGEPLLEFHEAARHTYFDQFRIFTAWARGSVVVSGPFEALKSFGTLPGIHLEVAELGQFPSACVALLKDAEKRAAIAANAQALLRKNYLPGHYAEKMLSILSAVAANPRAL